jgi:hypothetical protein
MTDVDRMPQFRLAVPAFVLAGSGANPPKHTGENIGQVIDFVRPAVVLFVKGTDVSRDVRGSRAGRLAGDIDAHVIKVFGLSGVNDLLLHGHLVSSEHVASNLDHEKHEKNVLLIFFNFVFSWLCFLVV